MGMVIALGLIVIVLLAAGFDVVELGRWHNDFIARKCDEIGGAAI